MRISQLIDQLLTARENHGDLQVNIPLAKSRSKEAEVYSVQVEKDTIRYWWGNEYSLPERVVLNGFSE